MHRNIVFVGSTGAGKSSTCNTLFRSESCPSEPFEVSHDEVSSTKTVVQHLSKPKDLNIIDTPGFGDSRFTDRRVNDSLSKLSSIFSTEDSKIDAFVLVVRLTPRAQTLKSDLEHMKNVFGKAGLKSTVLLLIYSGKKKAAETETFLEKLEKMEEITKLLKEGKQEDPSINWYCLWDNINPRPCQEEELLRKIEKLPPYTKQDFLKAQDQLNLSDEVKPKVKPTKVEDVPTLEDIDGDVKDVKDQSFSYAELEESMNRILEAMDMRQKSYKHRLENVLMRNDEMFEKFMNRVEELEKKDKEEEKKKETLRLLRDLICRKRKLGSNEKRELLGTTITEGVEKTSEKTAVSLGTKIGEKIGKKGGEHLQKSGDRVIKAMLE